MLQEPQHRRDDEPSYAEIHPRQESARVAHRVEINGVWDYSSSLRVSEVAPTLLPGPGIAECLKGSTLWPRKST